MRRIMTMAFGLVLAGGLAVAQTPNPPKQQEPVSLAPEDYTKARTCQENLAKLDGAKEQWALEFRVANNTTVTLQNLLDPNKSGMPNQGYLKRKPICPAGGEYKLNNIGTDPECSLGAKKGHALEANLVKVDAPTTSGASR